MGTLTITTSTAQDAKISDAFGKRLALGRNATGAEVKQEVINFIRQAVAEQDRIAAIRTAGAATLSAFSDL